MHEALKYLPIVGANDEPILKEMQLKRMLFFIILMLNSQIVF